MIGERESKRAYMERGRADPTTAALYRERTRLWRVANRERILKERRVRDRALRSQGNGAYISWSSMLTRCFNPKATNFSFYGGRGISVCVSWRNSFAAFLADMGPRPVGKTLDRKEPDGNYEPGNCRWATPKEQAANRRRR